MDGVAALTQLGGVADAARAVRVVVAADGRAANPFESVLRASALDVPDLSVTPQVMLGTALARGGAADRLVRSIAG
jgi:hypothetical protein